MKFIYNVILCFLFLKILLCQFEGECEDVNNQMDETQSEPDKTLERIRDYMWDIADNISLKHNLLKKKLNLGILPDEYPTNMKFRARKVRTDRKQWENVMLYPTEVWRSCIYPNFKIAYKSWCRQKMSIKDSTKKLDNCMNNFCLVCCDHLNLNFKETADHNLMGEKLMLTSNFGNVDYIITEAEINSCRKACNKHYPSEIPLVLPTPPRDGTLGQTSDNPAISCADIKKWGDENAKSGEYWVEVSTKGKQRVFCDMETDGGGWTLFYNYVHLPGQELILDSSKLPSNPSENSHTYLSNVGYSPKDVKELRFFCTEKFKDSKVYWHFKTINREFLGVALTGSQQGFRFTSLSDSYKELAPPFKINGRFKKRIFESMINEIDYYNISPEGGFAYTPFGSNKYKAYWTIRGPSLSYPKYECATSHDWVGGYATMQESPIMAETHHTVWFRGEAPSEEQVQRRLVSRLRNDPS